MAGAEIGRLGAILSAHAGEYPLQTAAVRLLLLTGCRKGEVLTLRWSDYREGRLLTLRYAHLADRDIEAAAERIGAELARVMGLR